MILCLCFCIDDFFILLFGMYCPSRKTTSNRDKQCVDLFLKKVTHNLLDIYGKYGNCCRIGGDELCVILNQHFDEVEALNEKFHQAIASLCQEAP